MDLTNRAVYLLTPKGAKLAQKAIDDAAAGKKKWVKFMRKHKANGGVLSCGRRLVGVLFKERPIKLPVGWRRDSKYGNGLLPNKRTAEGKQILAEMQKLTIPVVSEETAGETCSLARLPRVYYTIIHRVGKRYYVLACDMTAKPPPHGKKIPTSVYMKHVENTATKHQTYLNCEYP